jgi:hypothetical protein
MIHHAEIAQVIIGTNSTITVEYRDGTKALYLDRDDIKAVFRQVGQQEREHHDLNETNPR